MNIYLPIAEDSVGLLQLLAIGGGVGVLSGLFGVGGGFLLTPLLIFLGIAPTVSVGTAANQIVASSVSGLLAHWQRGNVDFRMGAVLTAGGLVGSAAGVWVFSLLKRLGQIDLAIGASYVVLLGSLGALMLYESVGTYVRRRRRPGQLGRLHQHYLLARLPFRMRFRKSRLYISAILPAALGFAVGVMTAIMGVGGGFLLVPAMIYLIGMPTSVVVGTSLFQIGIVSAGVTFMQATQNHNVDGILALILIGGGVIGAQIGAGLGAKLRGEQLRILLALIVLAVCVEVAVNLTVAPADPYSVEVPLDDER
jgi:uncharacterized membrane protein YfcA